MKRITIALAGLVLVACSSVERRDPGAEGIPTVEYNARDLQILAASMAESMIRDRDLNLLQGAGGEADPRPVVYVGKVQNRTSEHIDTVAITDRIKTALVQSDKFRVTTSTQGQKEIEDQVRFQQGTGKVDAATAKAFGRQVGADVIVYGNLIAIEKNEDRSIASGFYKKEDVFYQFTLEAVNIATGEVIWVEVKDIAKIAETGPFG